MINRWVERDGLQATLEELGIGSIAFTPLAQGMLTAKYLRASPRAAAPPRASRCSQDFLNEQRHRDIRALNDIAERRGQTLAQMAIAWVLRDGASPPR